MCRESSQAGETQKPTDPLRAVKGCSSVKVVRSKGKKIKETIVKVKTEDNYTWRLINHIISVEDEAA